MNYHKTFAVVKWLEGMPQPELVAGITVKPWVKYAGFVLQNVSGE